MYKFTHPYQFKIMNEIVGTDKEPVSEKISFLKSLFIWTLPLRMHSLIDYHRDQFPG